MKVRRLSIQSTDPGKLVILDGNHRKAVLCGELKLDSIWAVMINVVDQEGVWMTKEELNILQGGRNVMMNTKNICMCSACSHSPF